MARLTRTSRSVTFTRPLALALRALPRSLSVPCRARSPCLALRALSRLCHGLCLSFSLLQGIALGGGDFTEAGGICLQAQLRGIIDIFTRGQRQLTDDPEEGALIPDKKCRSIMKRARAISLLVSVERVSRLQTRAPVKFRPFMPLAHSPAPAVLVSHFTCTANLADTCSFFQSLALDGRREMPSTFLRISKTTRSQEKRRATCCARAKI